VGAKSIISSPSLPSLIVRVIDAKTKNGQTSGFDAGFSTPSQTAKSKKRKKEVMIRENG
jgi:hypothetical protein